MSTRSKRYVVTRIKDGKDYSTPYIKSDITVDYPHEWFSANPGKKPPVVVPITPLSSDSLSRVVYQQLVKQTLSSALVRAYIYDQLKSVSDFCTEDWRSFGILISKKGTQTKVFDMLEVKTEVMSIESVDGVDQPDNHILLANILCICRNNSAGTQIAGNATTEVLTRRFPTAIGQDPYVSFAQGRASFRPWVNDVELSKLLAAVDMFFFRFQTHVKANLRLGTIIYRYRDCAALRSMCYVMSQKGMDAPGQLMEWVWCETVASDFDRILEKDMEEIDDPYSYFPYSAALGLMKKSPYSVTANPALHAYCQTINTASGDARGTNARLVLANNMDEIIMNGLRTAYSLSAGKGSKLIFAGPGKIKEASRTVKYFEGGEDEDDIEDLKRIYSKKEPATKDPIEWYSYFEESGLESEKFNLWLLAVRDSIQDPREGSFGAYLKRHLTLCTSHVKQ